MGSPNLMMSIKKPDEVIPFKELFVKIPSFECKRPVLAGSLKVTFGDQELPTQTPIRDMTENVVAISDLTTFLAHLNQYIEYVNKNLKQRSIQNVILEAIKTKKGREVVKDLLDNSKFHPELNSKEEYIS
jgi:hypothetical protein